MMIQIVAALFAVASPPLQSPPSAAILADLGNGRYSLMEGAVTISTPPGSVMRDLEGAPGQVTFRIEMKEGTVAEAFSVCNFELRRYSSGQSLLPEVYDALVDGIRSRISASHDAREWEDVVGGIKAFHRRGTDHTEAGNPYAIRITGTAFAREYDLFTLNKTCVAPDAAALDAGFQAVGGQVRSTPQSVDDDDW